MINVPLIPRRVLFGEPAYSSPSLSPSGEHLAYLAPHKVGLNVWLGRLDNRDFRPLTDLRGEPIEDYIWARDSRHLLYLADRDGAENQHLFAIDLATGQARDLTPFDGVQVNVVGMSWHTPEHVLVRMNPRAPDRHELYRLRLTGGRLELVDAEQGLTAWIADQELRPRAAKRDNVDGGFTVVVRDQEDATWRSLLTVGYEDAMASQLIGFTGDGAYLLMLSPVDAEAVRLLQICTRTGAIDVLYADPVYDVVGASLHPTTGQADLVVVERERTELIPLAPDTAADLATMHELCRGDMTPLSRDLGNRLWLVQDNMDDTPATYRLYDRLRGTAEVLFTHQPELAKYTLAKVEPFCFTARDGLTIHGYLTFPPGQRHRLPTVLNVHGGPWDRNRWGFRAESQWLANRGYLCVEVNYRGSTGYGRGFTIAGDREWGGRMQDDLMDALRWVVKAGHADPDRVGICGASYGGYAALVGAAFTPEVFRCAVAVAAPVNLETFVRSVPDHWRPIGSRLSRRIGDPATDGDFLWSRSPLSRVRDIRIPLLLGYGKNDARVPVSEAEQLIVALRANRVPHEYILFDNEGHGFGKPANDQAFRAATECFLARHLGGRHEPGDGR